MTTIRPHRTATIGLVAALGLLAMLVAPVAAAPPERSRVQMNETFEEELCGEVWSVDQTVRGSIMLKPGQHGGPPRFFAKLSTVAIHTDPQDSDRGFILSSKDVQKDVGATLVEGTTYRIDNVHSSRYRVSTLDGDVIVRDRSRISWAFTIDTLGDDDPDNDALLNAEVVAVSGNPFEFDDADCDLIGEIAG